MLPLRGLTKSFLRGTPNEVKAIDRIDLEVRPGDFLTVIGSNGAGKSTLIKTIAGMALPDAGTIKFEGHDITPLPVRRRAAPIRPTAQDPGENTRAGMTIEEN